MHWSSMFPESDILCSFVCVYFTENFLSKSWEVWTLNEQHFQKKRQRGKSSTYIYGIIYLKLHRRKKMTARKKVQGLHVGELYYININ